MKKSLNTVLIIEDNDSKLSSIQAVLEKEIPSLEIYKALSVHSAIELILNNKFNLIIADMSLPTYDIESRESGGTPRPFGGIEIFETLECNEVITPVVVVTSYESISDESQSFSLAELDKRLSIDFPENHLGTVYFDSVYFSWEIELMNLIKESFEASNVA